MIKSLRQARITDGLPRVVAGQEWVVALSEALGAAVDKTLDYTDGSQIYTQLDTAPEIILDALAVNWKIDWYDMSFTLEQKRRTIKTALTVRRIMGTTAAVKLQVDAIYPGAAVEEWFQYGGEPGCFRVLVDLPDEGITKEEYRRLHNGVEITKNLRSHLDVINIGRTSEGILQVGGATTVCQTLEVWPELVTQRETTGELNESGITSTRQTFEVWPGLVSQIETSVKLGTGGITDPRRTIEIYPDGGG